MSQPFFPIPPYPHARPSGASAWGAMRSPAISSRVAIRKLARLALSIAPAGSFAGVIA